MGLSTTYTKTETDFLIQQLEKKSEALYTDDTLAGDIIKRVDINTGENVNYRKTTTWHDGSLMDDSKVDGVIYLKKGSKYIKRVYSDYADVRWFGAKGDGVDKGIGNYEGDHDAINLALRTCQRVKLEKGTYIVKKPIVLNDENELLISEDAVLKLGDAANCTLLKTINVDYPNDGYGNITYPTGSKRYLQKIKIINNGLIEGNGRMQNRTNGIDNNPVVEGTPIFKDGDNMEYFGTLIKIADVDNFYFKAGKIKDPRTYGCLFGGLRNYVIDEPIGIRTYKLSEYPNGDFLHFHGDCYQGTINRPYGTSVDDFIGITTQETGLLTLRKGNFIGLNIYDATYFGLHPDATLSNPIPMDYGIEAGYINHRFLRVSYTDDIIDDINVDGLKATPSKLGGWVVLSNLPFKPSDNGRNGYGNGRIVNFSCKNIRQTDAHGFIDVSDYVEVMKIQVDNSDYISIGMNNEGSFIKFNESFTSVPTVNDSNLIIHNLTIRDLYVFKGAVNPLPNGFINTDGIISNIYVDNLKSYNGSLVNFSLFGRAQTLNLIINNSDLSIFDDFFHPKTNQTTLFESGNIWKENFVCNNNFHRINSQTLPFSGLNAFIPKNGEIFNVKDRGLVYFSDGWKDVGYKKLLALAPLLSSDATDLPTAITLINEAKGRIGQLMQALKDSGLMNN